MEFPDLGKHCAHNSCHLLDFLPMKCNACSQIFCKDHIHYSTHNCSESYKKDNRVPTCPLCNLPIPIKPGESVDVKVDHHISTDCQSDPAKERRKIYTNKCSLKGCKIKELVNVTCDYCKKNFCLKHRHENDHQCSGSKNNSPSMNRSTKAPVVAKTNAPPVAPHIPASNNRNPPSLAASLSRERIERQALPAASLSSERIARQALPAASLSSERIRRQALGLPKPVGNYQAGLTEEEAIQRALQLSLSDPPAASTERSRSEQEATDLALARALEASEREAQRTRRGTTMRDGEASSCSIN